MLRIAAYARYSSTKQRSTSVDDQLRRSNDIAQRETGVGVDEKLTFRDDALSGTRKHIQKREGYKALIRAWQAGQFDVLVCNELSRLARNRRQLLEVQELIEDTGVRLITVDGIDTARDNWQMQFGLQAIVGEQSTRDTRQRVTGAMEGQLERGYMIGPPVFGYRLNRQFDERGNKLGTHWSIDRKKAEVIRRIFERRWSGKPLSAIARELNEDNIPPPRAKADEERYWRPGTIARLLQNKVYRGVFEWHGSSGYRAWAAQRRRDPKTKEFSRPELRLVEDEIWYACNQRTISRTGYGGGRHVLAGLVHCGICGAVLSVSKTGNARSLYCAQCCQARTVGMEGRLTGYLSATGLQHVLEEALRRVFTPPYVDVFRERLRQRLVGSANDDGAKAKLACRDAERACERIAEMVRVTDGNDDRILAEQYRIAKAVLTRAEERYQRAQKRAIRVDKQAIQQQIHCDPTALLPKLWESSVPPERVRAMLARLFDEIVFEEKPGRFEAIVRVTLSPAVAAAMVTGTKPVDDEPVVLRVRLTSGARRPSVWGIEFLDEGVAHAAREGADGPSGHRPAGQPPATQVAVGPTTEV